MSARKLLILAAVLAVLVAVAVFQANRTETKPEYEGLSPGDPLLPGLDVNQVAGVEITSGTTTAIVARKEAKWVVTTMYDYPADFAKLAEVVRRMGDLTVGHVERDGDKFAEDYGFAATGGVVWVRLLDSSRVELATLALGAVKASSGEGMFGGYPVGRYVRVGEGPVILVEGPNDCASRSEDWIQREILQVPPAEASEVLLATSNSSYSLRVKGGGQYEMDGLAEDEEIDQAAASRLVAGLQYFHCKGIADPALADGVMGLDAASTYVLKTADGLQYTAQVGGAAPDPALRYVRVSAEYHKPPPPTREEVETLYPETPPEAAGAETNAAPEAAAGREQEIEEEYARRQQEYESQVAAQEKKLAEITARVSGWTYLVPGYTAESLTIGREMIVRKKEKLAPPPQEAEPAPDAASQAE